MAYAELFKVRPWLESPAKWLNWAMGSTTARQLKDAQYNLQQFWRELEKVKPNASNDLDWAEILTLDAQSQWCLGNFLGAAIAQLLTDKNEANLTLYLGWLVPIFGNKILLSSYKSKEKIDELIPVITAEKNKAYAAAEKMNAEASKKYASAKTANEQVKNGTVIFRNTLKKQPGADKYIKTTSQNIDKNTPARAAGEIVRDVASASLLGLPVWAWAAMAVGLVLLVPSPRPSIQIGGSRA